MRTQPKGRTVYLMGNLSREDLQDVPFNMVWLNTDTELREWLKNAYLISLNDPAYSDGFLLWTEYTYSGEPIRHISPVQVEHNRFWAEAVAEENNRQYILQVKKVLRYRFGYSDSPDVALNMLEREKVAIALRIPERYWTVFSLSVDLIKVNE